MSQHKDQVSEPRDVNKLSYATIKAPKQKNHSNITAVQEREVWNALSAKYARIRPQQLSEQDFQSIVKRSGVSSAVRATNATISQDYTGSREAKEIAAFHLLAKKYGSSSTKVVDITAENIASDPRVPEQHRSSDAQGLNLDFEINPVFMQEGNSADVLQDFDFDSFLDQDNGVGRLSFDTSAFIDGEDAGQTTQSTPLPSNALNSIPIMAKGNSHISHDPSHANARNKRVSKSSRHYSSYT
jgi:hypothetical protein